MYHCTQLITVEDCYTLQEDLNTLNNWSQTWKMTFNTSKCEFLRITKKLTPILMQYYIQNDVIKVKHTKYLGVNTDHHLSWNEHINYISSKAKNNVKCFLQHNLSQCPIHIKSICYQTLLYPILQYACTVWAPHTQKNISTIN